MGKSPAQPVCDERPAPDAQSKIVLFVKMVFSSNIFLFFFLPLFLLVYLLSPDRFKNPVILTASLFFYAWGEQLLVLVMLFSTVADYCCGLLIASGHRKTGLYLSIFINLSLLCFFKYTGFFVHNLNTLMQLSPVSPGQNLGFMDIALPLGISFYTFQSMSYTIEVYRGTVRATRRFVDFACFVTMFPQLVAGPIVRYAQISKEIVSRQVTSKMFTQGIWRFILGLSKKVILANSVGQVADTIFALPIGEVDIGLSWLGAICYAFQIYYDFSGYSDMAIGLGKMLGFNFPENFNQPYRSQSITEFWRRWHMTLSLWFRDFVYIPLGGNRNGKKRVYINLVIVFLATGFWHGAAWNFIVWGLYHGFFLIMERAFREKEKLRLLPIIKVPMTFVIVLFGWILFRLPSLEAATDYMLVMLNLGDIAATQIQYFDFTYFLDSELVLWLTLSFIFAFFPKETLDSFDLEKPILLCLKILFSFVLFIYSAMILSTSSFNPFIYFRF